MDRNIWQQLLSLESQDITQQRFGHIHSKDLNARRAREINAATKQAREYFSNAFISNHSVRPLLTFYGVTSLSRALLLLLKVDGGEECLHAGHGIETVRWREVMSGNIAESLTRLSELKIRSCAGLFSDFVKHTNNRMAIHVRSGGIDWRCNYDVPERNEELSVGDLFSRIPDLRQDYSAVSDVLRYASVNELTYDPSNGFRMKVHNELFSQFRAVYESFGYATIDEGDYCIVTSSTDTLKREFPLFIHTYVNKMFESIPVLFVAEPFAGGTRYSQLCITYMVSYILGMLVRYYPTHWIALTQGDRGDMMWPTINRAQQLVEQSYPELVAEMIKDATATGHPFGVSDRKPRQSTNAQE